jgi:hypothetical protein
MKRTNPFYARYLTPEPTRSHTSGADYATKADLTAAVLNLDHRFTIRFASMLLVAVCVLLAAIRYLPTLMR